MRFNYEQEWNSEILNNLCQFYKGNGLSKNDLSDSGYSCILYGQLYTTYLNEVITSTVSKTNAKLDNPFYAKRNDLIIPSSGEDPIDIAVARSLQVDNVLLGGDLNVLRPKSILNSSFLSYQLNGKRKVDIAKIAQGKSIVHLHNCDLKRIKINYPCIEEQNKIANLLFQLDKLIETQIKIINKCKSLINQIYDCLLWNFKDTKKIKLSDILIEKNEKSKINDQYPILSSTVKGLFLQSEYFDREIASSNNIGYKITNKRDIIISPQNLWMGNITYNDKYDNGLVSPSYKIYTINDKHNPTYISTLLKSYRALYMFKTVSEQGASVVRRNLNLDSFYEISFNIPSKKEQDKISKLINSFNIKISLEEKYLQDLQFQKKFLLDNMFI